MKTVGIVTTILCLVCLNRIAEASISQSANFTLELDNVSSGAGGSGSANYSLVKGSFGEFVGEETTSPMMSSDSGFMPTVNLLIDLAPELEGTIDVSGTVDLDAVYMTVNSLPATLDAGSFVAHGVPLVEGPNTVTVTALDALGNSRSNSVNVILDTTPPPGPTLNSVATPTNITAQTLSGTKDSATSIWFNGVMVIPANYETSWSYELPLTTGYNNFVLFTKDLAGNRSLTSVFNRIFYDATPPILPTVSDSGIFTQDLSRLSASWSAVDPETGIAEYEYKIGTAPGGSDVVGATSAGSDTSVTATSLTLTQGQKYFISVRAKNGAGSWGDWGASDGIYADASIPAISEVVSPANRKYNENDSVTIRPDASDADGDALEYQFSVDGAVKQSWGPASEYSLEESDRHFGKRTIDVSVRDNYGGETTASGSLYFYKKALEP